MAIIHFRNRALEELFLEGKSRKIGSRYHKNILLILDFLDAVTEIKDCVGVKSFHELKGERRGTYSMHVTGNYCIIFTWSNEGIQNVDFEDYH